MSLHAAAQHLAKKGRGTDTTLVHMSPREVQGLQALAKAQGGSLSVNPKTGLVEAGFLEQALPIVAAAAATYFTAGAAAPVLSTALGSTMAGGILAGAGAGALIGGGTAALQGKDAGQAALYGGLGGAIAGGTGAYSDTGSLFSSAATPPVDASTQALTALPPPTPTVVPPPTAAGIQAASLPAGTAQNTALDALARGQGVFPEGSLALPGAAPNQQALYAAEAARTAPLPTPGSNFYATSNPITKAGILALPGIGSAAGDRPSVPGQEQYDPNSPFRWRLANTFTGSTPVQPNPYYQANYSGYAQGGLANLQGNMYPQSQQDTTQFATPSQMPTSAEVVRASYEPRTDAYTGQPMMMAGGGGISDLGGYSDGGRMLKGSGDGMSDSIPASIAGKQPARLADGEFVVPADVVSHLGNGSTDAGAKRLYSMMDKVRQARTGKKKQAPAVNPNKMMPA